MMGLHYKAGPARLQKQLIDRVMHSSDEFIDGDIAQLMEQ